MSERLEPLLTLRNEILDELLEADLEFTRLRIRVERMESDVRLGLAAPAELNETKGRLLPRAERRVLELFRELLKLEDRFTAAAGREPAPAS